MRKMTGCFSAKAGLMLLAACVATAQAQTFSVLHAFTGAPDGDFPAAGLITDSAGNLYGTTTTGGNFNRLCLSQSNTCGLVFKLSPTGTETVLYRFAGGTDGANPSAPLTRDAAGNLYGTTELGGNTTCDASRGCGTVFRIDPAGHESIINTFARASGSSPAAGVIRDSAGNLYGTTSNGGNLTTLCSPYGCGLVYELELKERRYKILYPFNAKADGGYPEAPLIRDAAGNLYGTASLGGTASAVTCTLGENSCGVVFKIDLLGNETVLYNFTGGDDGGVPFAGLIRDSAGNLYGTTYYGGNKGCPVTPFGCGVAFKLSPSGEETVLHTFTGGADGGLPHAGLIRDTAGNLYGTTEYGGDMSSSCPVSFAGCGVVFKIDPSGNETVLHAFSAADGYEPLGGVTLVQGSLYGTASVGGPSAHGVVFKITLQ